MNNTYLCSRCGSTVSSLRFYKNWEKQTSSGIKILLVGLGVSMWETAKGAHSGEKYAKTAQNMFKSGDTCGNKCFMRGGSGGTQFLVYVLALKIKR